MRRYRAHSARRRLPGPLVEGIHFTPPLAEDAETGLLGYVECTVSGPLRVEGITVRRTRSGQLRLSFPEHSGPRGQRRRPVRPEDSAARTAIERAVIEELRKRGDLQ